MSYYNGCTGGGLNRTDPWPECDHRFHQHTAQRTPATAIPFSANLARIEDLGQDDFVKNDCAACRHIALLTPQVLLRARVSPVVKVLDLKERLRS